MSDYQDGRQRESERKKRVFGVGVWNRVIYCLCQMDIHYTTVGVAGQKVVLWQSLRWIRLKFTRDIKMVINSKEETHCTCTCLVQPPFTEGIYLFPSRKTRNPTPEANHTKWAHFTANSILLTAHHKY